MHNLLDHIS